MQVPPYLSSHGGGAYARTVPMIDPVDLPTIMKLHKTAENIDNFWVVVIDPSKVLYLSNANHQRLPKNGEFFGEVPQSAVLEITPLKNYLSRPNDQ